MVSFLPLPRQVEPLPGGINVCDPREGEDVGVTNIEGIVKLIPGKVIILRVPNTQHGGTRKFDAENLRQHLLKRDIIKALGIEAIITLRRTGNASYCHYGTSEAIIEANVAGAWTTWFSALKMKSPP